MDSYSRFSRVYLVYDETIFYATVAFETTWVAQFWPPMEVQGDQAFENKEFFEYLISHGIKFRPIPNRKHHKRTLEPKHNEIRSIFLRLVHA